MNLSKNNVMKIGTTVVLGFLVFYLFQKYFNKMNNSITEEFYEGNEGNEADEEHDENVANADPNSTGDKYMEPVPIIDSADSAPPSNTEPFADYSGTGNENNHINNLQSRVTHNSVTSIFNCLLSV